MSFYPGRFNVYLCGWLLLASASSGCAWFHSKPPQALGAVRVHIESPPGPENQTQAVSILRADPVLVTILKDPVVTEADLLRANLVESPGGFFIELRFDSIGSYSLEEFTSAYQGKHFAIFGQWGDRLKDGRWLAAPLITKRDAAGTLSFTPDMSREEARQWVEGLNNKARIIHTGK